jgi:hypothetical protein
MSKKGQTTMAIINLNGVITNLEVKTARYAVTSIEVDGPFIFVKAVDLMPTGVKVNLTIVIRDRSVDVGYFRKSNDLKIYDKGVFSQPKKESASEQACQALAGL